MSTCDSWHAKSYRWGFHYILFYCYVYIGDKMPLTNARYADHFVYIIGYLFIIGFIFHPYSPIEKQIYFLWNLNCCSPLEYFFVMMHYLILPELHNTAQLKSKSRYQTIQSLIHFFFKIQNYSWLQKPTHTTSNFIWSRSCPEQFSNEIFV